MMEKPKPEEKEAEEVEEELPVTVDDREAEIERRLAALEVDVDEPETEPQVEETVEEQPKEEEEEPVVQIKEVEPVAVVPPPVVQEKPVAEPVKPNNKSALLVSAYMITDILQSYSCKHTFSDACEYIFYARNFQFIYFSFYSILTHFEYHSFAFFSRHESWQHKKEQNRLKSNNRLLQWLHRYLLRLLLCKLKHRK